MIIDVWAQPTFTPGPDRLPMPEVTRLAEKSGAQDRFTAPIGPDELVAEMDSAGVDMLLLSAWHRPGGWVLPDYTDLADCTTNFHRQQDGRPPCTDTAVWKVVEDHGMHLTIGFYCDTDLPAQHRKDAA